MTSNITLSARRKSRGFTLIELLIVTGVIAVLSSFALPSMIASRNNANETSAISSLRLIALAEETYRARQATPAFGTVDDLVKAKLLNAILASGHKSGYSISAVTKPSTNTYTFIASPDPGAGARYFFLDQTGVIRAKEGAPATATSSPVQ